MLLFVTLPYTRGEYLVKRELLNTIRYDYRKRQGFAC